jgi:uncharacterized membrane protein
MGYTDKPNQVPRLVVRHELVQVGLSVYPLNPLYSIGFIRVSPQSDVLDF